MSDLKQHKTKAMDNAFIQKKLLPWLIFNPGLALTGFQTTQPRFLRVTFGDLLLNVQKTKESSFLLNIEFNEVWHLLLVV